MRTSVLASLCILAVHASAMLGHAQVAKRVPPPTATSSNKVVDLFAASESGQIELRIIPRDEKQARIFMTNKTDEILTVRLPATYAAVPIVSQVFGQLPNNNNAQNQPMAQSAQVFGGPMMMQQPNNAPKGPLGLFNIPPEQTRDVRVMAICLEHGKANPRAAMPYRVVPLDSVARHPAIEPLLREYGEGKCSRLAVQAAAWHLSDGLDWDELAKKPGAMIAATVYEPYFSKGQIKQAKALVAAAEEQVVARAKPAPSVGEKLQK
ncbi:MAG TPA: hypothetical protein VG713_22525 [Pirellulales bacterium]|nr:hypothetical protein [Pirellulales bacterium]